MTATARVKRPIDPQRICPMPRQFGPLNRRLVYQGHIRLMSLEQIALYTFLVCVSDAQGLSFYSDERTCRELSMSLNGLWDAREGLMDRGLLLDRRPIYQLLNLPRSQEDPR